MNNISQADLCLLLCGTVEHALGRRSYVVGEAARLVRELWPALGDGRRDALERIVRDHVATAGDSVESEWVDLLGWVDAQRGEWVDIGESRPRLDTKRLYLPGIVVRAACPVCGEHGSVDMGDDYVEHYGRAGGARPVRLYCEACDRDFTVHIRVRLRVEQRRTVDGVNGGGA